MGGEKYFSPTEVSFPGRKCLFPDEYRKSEKVSFPGRCVYIKLIINLLKFIFNTQVNLIYSFTHILNCIHQCRPGKDPSLQVAHGLPDFHRF